MKVIYHCDYSAADIEETEHGWVIKTGNFGSNDNYDYLCPDGRLGKKAWDSLIYFPTEESAQQMLDFARTII